MKRFLAFLLLASTAWGASFKLNRDFATDNNGATVNLAATQNADGSYNLDTIGTGTGSIVLNQMVGADNNGARVRLSGTFNADGSFSLATNASAGGGAPTGAAGGDLGGSYPNPTVLSLADVTTGVLAGANGGTGVANTGKTLTLGGSYTINGTTGSTLNIATGGTLGTAAFTAASAYLASGTAAGGDLAGTYPNPTIKASVGLTGLPTITGSTTGAVNLLTAYSSGTGTTTRNSLVIRDHNNTSTLQLEIGFSDSAFAGNLFEATGVLGGSMGYINTVGSSLVIAAAGTAAIQITSAGVILGTTANGTSESGSLTLGGHQIVGLSNSGLDISATNGNATFKGGTSGGLITAASAGGITLATASNGDISLSANGTGKVKVANSDGLALRDTSAAFDVTLVGTSSTTLTAGRTLTVDMGNVAHTLAFGTTAGTITFPNTAAMTVARIDAAQTFTGVQTMTSPVFITPTLGAATATSINGNIFTTGSSTYTGTAGQTYTFPTTSATIARTDATNTFTGVQQVNSSTAAILTLAIANGTAQLVLANGTTDGSVPHIRGDSSNLILNAKNTTANVIINREASTAHFLIQGVDMRLGSAVVQTWANTTDPFNATVDIGEGRSAAGLLEVNSGTAGVFRDLKVRQHYVDQTITAGGTTGAQTINKAAGTVNFAAAATSLVVTDSLVTTSSTIYCSIRTNDATAIIKNVVPAAGSFTITLNAAATAETSVGFLVVN